MIPAAEVGSWAARFGVPSIQIERDHFISHLLSVLAEIGELRFFGGTALCRTHLRGSRLSEDVDLLSRSASADTDALAAEMPRALRTRFAPITVGAVVRESDGFGFSIGTTDFEHVKVYVGRDGPNLRAYAFAPSEVDLRYSDLPATVTLECPTLPSFAAMKLSAWYDRHAPRDLFDLAGLARLGALADPEVSAMFRVANSFTPTAAEFARAPKSTVTAWEPELGAQVGLLPPIDACLRDMREALQPE